MNALFTLIEARSVFVVKNRVVQQEILLLIEN